MNKVENFNVCIINKKNKIHALTLPHISTPEAFSVHVNGDHEHVFR